MKTSKGQIIECASWRLVSEISRRFPTTFRIVETHPGSGLYDCLSLYDIRERHIADFNRAGRFHVFNRFDGACQLPEPFDIWPAMENSDDPKNILNKICEPMGLPVPAQLPSSIPSTLTYRFISEFLSHSIFGIKQWECRNGCIDTSGYGSGISHYFERFAGAKVQLRVKLPSDILSEPAYRFWFLIRNSRPLLCLETTGIVWTLAGESFQLPNLYARTHRMWPIITKVAGDLLP